MAVYNLPKVYLLFIFLNVDVITSENQLLPNVANPKSGKLTECRPCKLLTDSFNHWLEKTSRGKFEGGDAAWEEAKLNSYARSEVRFVEIQEGLCSELKRNQDDCYALAEEAEQLLESWWFNNKADTKDLHTFLCIDTLKYCCPKNHFGENCIPCSVGNNNEVCSGHGKCDGDGTRKGNGSCICKAGYTGEHCNGCAKNYYAAKDTCKQCYKACDGCSGEGMSACEKCKSGWQMQSNGCVDIDECQLSSVCKPDQYCVNKEGTYSCEKCHSSCKSCIGGGLLNCTQCHEGNVNLLGICVKEETKDNYSFLVFKQIVLYLAMFVITCYVFRTLSVVYSVAVLITFCIVIYKSARWLREKGEVREMSFDYYYS